MRLNIIVSSRHPFLRCVNITKIVGMFTNNGYGYLNICSSYNSIATEINYLVSYWLERKEFIKK